MSFWEKLEIAFRWFLAVAFFLTGVGLMVAWGLFGLFAGLLFFLASGLCVFDYITGFFATRSGRLLYPRVFLQAPAKKIAAAEGLLARKDYEGASEAFAAILKEEPGNLVVGFKLAKILAETKGEEGRFEACAVLINLLDRLKRPLSGESEAVLLLCDLLEESGLHGKAEAIIGSELKKGYCRAEEALLKRRLEVLELGPRS